MTKIPVRRSIGSAYGFAFANLATILGLIWLPLAILLCGEYFAISRYLDAVLTALANGNRFAIYTGVGYLYLYRFAALFLEAMIAVPIMRQSLGLRTKGAFVHFALGADELRMFGAFVAFFLVVLTIEIVGVVVWLAFAAGSTAAARMLGTVDGISALVIAGWSTIILAACLIGALLYVYVRLGFFLVAVTVAEKRIDLGRSWILTQDNFWRVFCVFVSVTLPVWLLYLALQMEFSGFAAFQDASNFVPFANQFASSSRVAAIQVHAILNWLPYLFGAWFLIQPLSLGLAAGAAAAAYRTLVPEPAAVSTLLADGPLAAATS